MFKTLHKIKFIVVIFLTSLAYSGNVTSDDAFNVANNWITYSAKVIDNNWNGERNPNITIIEHSVSETDTLAYVFQINPSGYVVVAQYREITPIIAYSTTQHLDLEAKWGFACVLSADLERRNKVVEDFLTEHITLGDSPNELQAIEVNREKWAIWSVESVIFEKRMLDFFTYEVLDIDHLLQSEWHQREPYNDFCPIGDGGQRCRAGCVATATSQLMRYWQWPPSGEGSHCYWWDGDGSAPGDELCAVFSDSYDWSNMLLDYSFGYSDDEASAVAELCYEVGVAYEMDYGATSSGTDTDSCVSVLPSYFKYVDDIIKEIRPDYTPDGWFNMIQGDLNAGRPLLYRIFETGWAGHAMVCDGWRISGGNNQIHINYGWGDSHNDWYTVDDLYYGSEPENDEVYRGIRPAHNSGGDLTLYPETDGYVRWPWSNFDNPFCDEAFSKVFKRGNNDRARAGLKFPLLGQCFTDQNLEDQVIVSAILYLNIFDSPENTIRTCRSEFSDSCELWDENSLDWEDCGRYADGVVQGDWLVFNVIDQVREWCIHGGDGGPDHYGKFIIKALNTSSDAYFAFRSTHHNTQEVWPYLEIEVAYRLGDPANLEGARNTCIDISWSDNSIDESGFEIHRSECGGSWQILDTVGRNETEFQDCDIEDSLCYSYKVRAFRNCPDGDYYSGFSNEIDFPTGVDEEPYRHIPLEFQLFNNHPNPFNAQTSIKYSLPEAAHVTIEIYDLLGRKVETLIDEHKQAGYHQVIWEAKNVSSGMYFYKIQAGEFVETKKMLLLK